MTTPKTEQAPGRYDAIIERMQNVHDSLVEERRYARDDMEQRRIAGKLGHLRRGLALFREANDFQPKLDKQGQVLACQFGAYHARELQVRIPPTIDEFAELKPLRFRNYRYITSEPVEILYLRKLVKSQRIPGLQEMEPGLVGAMPKEGEFIGFVPEAFYEQLGRAKVLKTR